MNVQAFMIPIRQQIRNVAFWLILFMLLTGLYNMGGGLVHDAPKHHQPNPEAKKVEAIMHLIAFTAGVTAAYVGITIGG